MRTTSFAGAGGFNEFGPTRFAASACCTYASIMSGEAMPVPPVMPLIMPAREAPPIGDISARRSTAPPEPMRVKPNPQMTKGRYPSENPDPVKLLPPAGEWVRPDLNRSRQHPKLVGFLVGRMMRGPRAQTKLPHGPAGRLEGLRR